MSTSNIAPSITILGVRVKALERIPRAGTIVGGLSRSSAYRLAEADGWPTVGPDSSRWVLMIPLLERYGIPYEIGHPSSEGLEESKSGSSVAVPAVGQIVGEGE